MTASPYKSLPNPSNPCIEEFEGGHWLVTAYHSNRSGIHLEFTTGVSDRTYVVPKSRIASTYERLESGEDPDIVAESFPWGW